jgi:multimeric flavodoxin WrbA
MPRTSRSRILGLFGSPRQGGNTDLLLQQFLRGCESRGAEVESLVLASLEVRGCLECGGCAETGQCVIRDEMSTFWAAFERCSHMALACPVYFYGVPAQAKAVVDRCQSRWTGKYREGKAGGVRLGKPPRKGYLLSVAGSRGKRVFEGVRLTTRYFFDALDVDYAGELLYPGVDEKGDIRKHPTALKESFAAGAGFV